MEQSGGPFFYICFFIKMKRKKNIQFFNEYFEGSL